MKQVWVNSATWAVTRSTTRGAELPTLVTAMPEPKSISELPSTSTTTPPPAWVMKTGRVVPMPGGTAACLRVSSSCDLGPGISVTRRRSCGSDGPPCWVVMRSRYGARRDLPIWRDGTMGAALLAGMDNNMAPTLRTVARRMRLAVLAGPADRLDRPVRWAAVRELEDPTPFLEGGELLLTTGMQVTSHHSEYVARLLP